uniref:Uncharacterized protein n=1 Tax=Psilocybe cubensis TaxID=181762 RepID=A0A8H7XRY6_PSICU
MNMMEDYGEEEEDEGGRMDSSASSSSYPFGLGSSGGGGAAGRPPEFTAMELLKVSLMAVVWSEIGPVAMGWHATGTGLLEQTACGTSFGRGKR